MAESIQFGFNVSCFCAMNWSFDNRLAICGDDSMKILALNPCVDHQSKQPHFQQSVIPVNEFIYNMPKFADKEIRYLIKTLSRDDYSILMTDTVMNPTSPAAVARKGFCAADWSPKDGDEVGRCILAVLSHDFRLCLFSQKSSVFDWFKVCDLSEMYWNSNKFEGDKLKNYKEFQQHCHDLAVVAISWCPSVFTEHVSEEDEKPRLKYSILATSSNTGNIVLWRIKLPCLDQSDCSVLLKLTPYSSYPTYMSWSKNSGFLAVGYADGQIHALKLDMMKLSHDPTVVSIFDESDLMRISCLNVVSHPETEGEIILANKEQCILAFSVSLDQGMKVVSEIYIEGENTLHGTGFAGNFSNMLMSSADGIIQLIKLSMQEGGLHISTEKLWLDVNSALLKSGKTYSWQIYGISSSPNRILMAYVARPSSSYDHLNLKRPTVVQIIPFKMLPQTSQIRSEDLSAETSSEYMDFDMDQQVIDLLTNDEVVPRYDMKDALESIRSNIFMHRTTNPTVERESLVRKSLGSLKIKRYQNLVLYHTKYKKKYNVPVVMGTETADDIAAEEERMRINKKLEELINKITDLILAIQISISVECLILNRTQTIHTTQGNRSLKNMLEFITTRPFLLTVRPGLSKTVNYLEELLDGELIEEETCFCQSRLVKLDLTATCSNGHKFGVCSKSLLLCDSMDYRTCNTCYCIALSKSRLKDFPWLPGENNSCSLCDGILL